MAQGDQIRSWIEKGGRLVCLEQSREGEISFAKPLRFLSSGDMLFADQIDPAHPTQKGFKPGYWELWNGSCIKASGGVDATAKAVHSHYIIPLPESVVLSGVNRAPYRFGQNPVLGMVSGEIKLGKGLIFFSQPLAVSRFGTDPMADLHLRALFTYTLGPQWTGEHAANLKNITPPAVTRE